MAVYAYLRVSTDQQDVDNQRYGVLVYANARGSGRCSLSQTPRRGGSPGGSGRWDAY